LVSHKQHKYWRILIYDICKWLGVPKCDYEKAKPHIHKALKDYFGVRSLKDLSSVEFERMAYGVRILWAVNFAHVLKEPDEEKFDPNTCTLHDLLVHKKII
jgi:hypothetical protein